MSRNGQIVWTRSGAPDEVLTHGNCDEEPGYSSDGRFVSFVRRKHCDKRSEATLMMLDRTAKRFHAIVSIGAKAGEWEIRDIYRSYPDPANGAVWFSYDMGTGTVGGSGLGMVELKTARVQHVTTAVGMWPVRGGPHRGKLVLVRRTFLLQPEVVYWSWIFDPRTKRIEGILATEEAQTLQYLRQNDPEGGIGEPR